MHESMAMVPAAESAARKGRVVQRNSSPVVCGTRHPRYRKSRPLVTRQQLMDSNYHQRALAQRGPRCSLACPCPQRATGAAGACPSFWVHAAQHRAHIWPAQWVEAATQAITPAPPNHERTVSLKPLPIPRLPQVQVSMYSGPIAGRCSGITGCMLRIPLVMCQWHGAAASALHAAASHP
jgi:hypothetical protein